MLGRLAIIGGIFVVMREVKDKITYQVVTVTDYSEVGILTIAVALITFALPIGTVIVAQNSRFRMGI